MLYLYNAQAGSPSLTLTGDEHRYLFKVRRHKLHDRIHLRNLQDGNLYTYEVIAIDKRQISLTLEAQRLLEVKAPHHLHLGWCVIDPKNVEKMLPSLNEMGVAKISFIYCLRSQKSFKLDFKRLEKILLNSSQQSGRSVMMELEMVESLEAFVAEYPEAKMLNFSREHFVEESCFDTIVIGCEGGFTTEEVALFSQEKIVGFQTPLVLKSETAVCAVASSVLL